jgi:hypothetical protein
VITLKPYEYQKGETKKAFEAFQHYRDMGADRSIRKVAEKLGKSEQLLSRWSSQYDWVERAAKYDGDMDKLALVEMEKERKSMLKRHAQQAVAFQRKALERLKDIKPEELEPKDLIRFFVESVKIERLSRGETTESAEVKHSGEIKESVEHDVSKRVEKYADLYFELSAKEKHSKNEGDNEGDDN